MSTAAPCSPWSYDQAIFDLWATSARRDATISNVVRITDYALSAGGGDAQSDFPWGDTRPPSFQVPQEAPQLVQGTGTKPRDPNVAACPTWPMECPAAMALEFPPWLRCGEVDIFASAKALDTLLSVFMGKAKESTSPIAMEKIGGTVIMTLDDGFDRPAVTFPENDYIGSFLAAYTRKDVTMPDGGPMTNHRIISYDFCGLNFLVYFRVDAYLPELCQEECEKMLAIPQGALVSIKLRSKKDRDPNERFRKVEDREPNKRLRKVDEMHIAREPSMWIRNIKQFRVALRSVTKSDNSFDQIVARSTNHTVFELMHNRQLSAFGTFLQVVTAKIQGLPDSDCLFKLTRNSRQNGKIEITPLPSIPPFYKHMLSRTTRRRWDDRVFFTSGETAERGPA